MAFRRGRGAINEALRNIDANYERTSSRLQLLEDKLSYNLSALVANTEAMANSLEAMRQTNAQLITGIASRQCIHPALMIIIFGLLAAVFMIRELAVSGGEARVGLDGVAISSGNHHDAPK